MTKDKKVNISDIAEMEESVLDASAETIQKTMVSYEERLKYVNEVAHPMASRKLTKRIYKLLKKAASNKESCKAGLKLVQSSIRKGSKGLVILAGDVSPVDVMIHLPAVCEDQNIPYCYVPSKEDLGRALGFIRSVITVLITSNSDIEEALNDIITDVKALPNVLEI